MVAAAQRAGWPVSIYRCGLLSGNSKTGHCPERDLLSLYLRSEASARRVLNGAAFDGSSQVAMDLTPVDYAAAAIVRLGEQENLGDRLFHIASETPVTAVQLH